MRSEDEIRTELAEQKQHRNDITNDEALRESEEPALELANERILMLEWVLERDGDDPSAEQSTLP